MELQSQETDQIATAFAAAQLEYPDYIGPNIWQRQEGKWIELHTEKELFEAATRLEPRYYRGEE